MSRRIDIVDSKGAKVDADKRDDHEETGECACGSVAEYFGPDPFSSALCDAYRCTVHPCEPGCGCWDEGWMCWDCYDRACEDL